MDQAPASTGTILVDDIEHFVTFAHNGPVTTCNVSWKDEGVWYSISGEAFCNPSDTYDPQVGRKIAMRRACKIDYENYWGHKFRNIYSAWRKSMR